MHQEPPVPVLKCVVGQDERTREPFPTLVSVAPQLTSLSGALSFCWANSCSNPPHSSFPQAVSPGDQGALWPGIIATSRKCLMVSIYF